MAHFGYIKPRTIDLAKIQQAAHDAAYTIKRLEIEVTGKVVRQACERCGDDAHFFRVEPTGQRIEIANTLAIGSTGIVRLTATGWGKDRMGVLQPKRHVVFKVESFVPSTPEGEGGSATE